MWKKHKNKDKSKIQNGNPYPIRDISIHELRQAIQEYAEHLPEGIELKAIIHPNLTINYDLLAPYLKGIPKETYYMSRETYEVFEEKDYPLAADLDMVQIAVDQYISQEKKLPIIDGDPYKKVSYYKLEKLNLLSHRPNRDFYITDEECLITYKKPS